jgi:hypothetical protein
LKFEGKKFQVPATEIPRKNKDEEDVKSNFHPSSSESVPLLKDDKTLEGEKRLSSKNLCCCRLVRVKGPAFEYLNQPEKRRKKNRDM